MLKVKMGEKEWSFGGEIRLETDGINLSVSDGEMTLRKSYKSPLELLYVMSWFMKATEKTTLVLKEGETEFTREKEYRIGELRL